MAASDYMQCAVCGGKALYDAYLDYDYFRGEVEAVCETCARAGWTLAPVRHPSNIREA